MDSKVIIKELGDALIGMHISCTIDGDFIDSAMIQEEDGCFYICQNEKAGSSCIDKLGYRYSWVVGNGSSIALERENVRDIICIAPTEKQLKAIKEAQEEQRKREEKEKEEKKRKEREERRKYMSGTKILFSKDTATNQKRLDDMVFNPNRDREGWDSSKSGYKFQIVSNKGHGCYKWVSCRDYIHDMYRMALLKCDTEHKHFGPGYTKVMQDRCPMPTNLIMIAVKGMDNKAAKCALKLLHHYEDMLGFPHSVHSDKSIGDEKMQVFMGSPKWLVGGGFISLYTFWMRLSVNHSKYGLSSFKNDSELQHTFTKFLEDPKLRDLTDMGYLKDIAPVINKVLAIGGSKLFSGEWAKGGPAEMNSRYHSLGGIQELCRGKHANINANRLVKKLLKN